MLYFSFGKRNIFSLIHVQACFFNSIMPSYVSYALISSEVLKLVKVNSCHCKFWIFYNTPKHVIMQARNRRKPTCIVKKKYSPGILYSSYGFNAALFPLLKLAMFLIKYLVFVTVWSVALWLPKTFFYLRANLFISFVSVPFWSTRGIGVFRILSNKEEGALCENSWRPLVVTHFRKNAPS